MATEAQKLVAQQQPLQQGMNTAIGNMQQIASSQYQFDPNQFLPQIQQQAESIYSPQKSQLEAIRQLQSSQAQEQRLLTTEQFDEQLQTEIESINRRGAYFSGGAVAREQEIGDQKTRALKQLGLQSQAADFTNLAQQAGLSAEQTQFVQDRLYNAEASAYNRWSNQRNFLYGAAKDQYQVYQQERNYIRDVFESDRSFKEGIRQFEANYDLKVEDMKLTKDRFDFDKYKFGEQFALDVAQFNLSKAKSYSGNSAKEELMQFNASMQDAFASNVSVGEDNYMRQEDFREWIGRSYATAGGDLDKMQSVNQMSQFYMDNFTNPRDVEKNDGGITIISKDGI